MFKVACGTVNYPRFVYYFFKSVAPQIARMDVGSVNLTLNRNHVHPMPIVWPPLAEQKAIAAVLGALDDKIELAAQFLFCKLIEHQTEGGFWFSMLR